MTSFIFHSNETFMRIIPSFPAALRPYISPCNLCHSLGAGREKESSENSVEPHKLTRSLSSPFPSKHLGPGMMTVQVGDATEGARHIQPEAAPATTLSTHRQMVRCSNSLSELITPPPEDQLHSGTISHFPDKCVSFPQCFLPTLFWADCRACS